MTSTAVARSEGCDRVWFGATAPLALMAEQLGVERVVSSSHGHELGWGALPGAKQLLHRMAARVDVITALSDYTLHAAGDRCCPAAPWRTCRAASTPSCSDPGQVTGWSGHGTASPSRPVVVCVSQAGRRARARSG